jgi:hypothetical protein
MLFVPALAFLFASAYYGVAAQRNCLALMLIVNPDVSGAKHELNGNLRWQLNYMQIGFSFLGVRFLTFLLWWIFDKGINPDKKG